MKLEVVSYYIQYGVGQDGRYDLDRTMEAIRAQPLDGVQQRERIRLVVAADAVEYTQTSS
jgi:endonuclease/exonuclease/phosphatase family metal-dependent hydrolase